MVKKLKFKEAKAERNVLKLDLGSGKGANTPEGFVQVDKHGGKGIKKVDLTGKWPWKSNSVDEARCAYLIHYLTAQQRVKFFNELYRVLKPGAQCQLVTPHWCANRAYADMNVQWPPVAEGFYHTLSKPWREQQNHADEFGLCCNFDATMGYGMHPSIVPKNTEYQQNAVMFYREAAQDLIATITKA
jgi:SAM-dependent methyltransferase